MPSYQGQQQVPRLSSQREDYLQLTLRLMRDGQAYGRDTIMTTALEGLDHQALDDLAHYFANRDQPGKSPVLK
jgi:cytochrome c553